jgi:hypothetical protein
MPNVSDPQLVITLLVAEQNPPGASEYFRDSSLLVLDGTELTPVQQLAALRRAVTELEERLGLTDDPAAIDADVEAVLERFLASRTTAPAEQPADNINRPAACDTLPATGVLPDGQQICWRCCEPYWPDGSPNLVMCGPCDLVEFEAHEQADR